MQWYACITNPYLIYIQFFIQYFFQTDTEMTNWQYMYQYKEMLVTLLQNDLLYFLTPIRRERNLNSKLEFQFKIII